MLPVFLVAVGDGDSADLTFLPLAIQSRVKGNDFLFRPSSFRTLLYPLSPWLCCLARNVRMLY